MHTNKHEACDASTRNMLVCKHSLLRNAGEGKDIELRHQRNPDVLFDCVRKQEGEKASFLALRARRLAHVTAFYNLM